MPLPPRQSAALSTRRTAKCPQCNNLDPRGHAFSTHSDTPVSKRKSTTRLNDDVRLSLPVDSLKLSRLESRLIHDKTCRFCDVLAKAIDAYVSNWRRRRPSITLDLAWKRPIRITIGSGYDTPVVLEIYANPGKAIGFCVLSSFEELMIHNPQLIFDLFPLNYLKCVCGCLVAL
jgi:hypothetical protein